MSPAPAPLRRTRAAMFAAVCVALAALGHAYMSGHDLPVPGLLAAFGVTGALAWWAAGRRRGSAAIGGALLVVQGALHLLFSAVGEPHAPPPTAHAPTDMSGMDHGALTAAAPITAADPMATMDAMPGMGSMPGVDGMGGMEGMGAMAALGGHGGLGMIAAHVLAALFCALWLARGEAAVFRLARALGALAVVAAAPLRRALGILRAHRPHTPARPARRRAPEPPRVPRGAVHAYDVVRRGPPGMPHVRATAPGRPARA
ncbi:hypothetical protein [Streptomyces sp. G-G2]|uniref:hypothetical protein n=1 Tax=Streptomyces sp. G-G2 TaxID=3046201 RepID=UPI0024BB6E7F|nr:hypothetical protein [Streptomyces sp. G-G2]MDJ0382956.1 hypothetical protein [Streptomyces sp. G-G2]